MKNKINLEEILWKSFHDNGIPKPTHSLAEITKKAVKEAMKEACKQVLELAAENAYCSLEHPDDDNNLEESDYIVSKYSIVNTINQVE